jgi:hypothetical protein
MKRLVTALILIGALAAVGYYAWQYGWLGPAAQPPAVL